MRPARTAAAPILVSELLILRDLRVGAIQPDRHVAVHLVRAADERQTITAIEIAIVFQVLVVPVLDHLHRVGAAGGNQHRRFAVRVRQMRNDHRAALGVAGVGPVRHRLLQRAAQLRLARPIGTPRHHRLLQSPQRQVPQHVLAIFLRAVDDGVAAVRHRCPERVLGVGEEMAPLRLQQVDDVQVFALRLAVRAVRAEKMDVRVAAEPALRVHVRPALEPQRQLALSRLDAQTLSAAARTRSRAPRPRSPRRAAASPGSVRQYRRR